MSFTLDKEQVEALAASEKLVGPIYKVIKSDRSGRVLSGEHRLRAKSTWPIERRHFKNDYEEELFRIEANTHRTVTEEENKLRFKHLAEACVKDLHIKPKKVCLFLIKKLASRYSPRRIRQLLDDCWKGEQGPKKKETVSISTMNLLARTDEKSAHLKGALARLGENLKVEEKTYGIGGPNCLCPKCTRRDECY